MENFKQNIDERIDQTGRNQNALYFDLEELTVNVTRNSDEFNSYRTDREKKNEAQRNEIYEKIGQLNLKFTEVDNSISEMASLVDEEKACVF